MCEYDRESRASPERRPLTLAARNDLAQIGRLVGEILRTSTSGYLSTNLAWDLIPGHTIDIYSFTLLRRLCRFCCVLLSCACQLLINQYLIWSELLKNVPQESCAVAVATKSRNATCYLKIQDHLGLKSSSILVPNESPCVFDRTNDRAFATVLRLSSSVYDVMYRGWSAIL